MTNGSLLDERMARDLIKAGVGQFIIGVKAFDDLKHREYTGRSNREVLRSIGMLASLDDMDFDLQVETILLPGVNDAVDVEGLARFISTLDRSISLFIEPFIPSGDKGVEPTRDDLIRAMSGAMRHLYVCSYHPLFSEIQIMRSSPRRAVFVEVFPE